jgi:tRNA(Arg) A34 adenosine deaminase TadA
MQAWIRLANKVACRSLHPKHPMGAVIVRSGSVISLSPNSPRWGAHAELRAITKCWADPQGATIIVSRLTGTRLAKPCNMCAAAIREAGIKRLVYTTELGYNVERLF